MPTTYSLTLRRELSMMIFGIRLEDTAGIGAVHKGIAVVDRNQKAPGSSMAVPGMKNAHTRMIIKETRPTHIRGTPTLTITSKSINISSISGVPHISRTTTTNTGPQRTSTGRGKTLRRISVRGVTQVITLTASSSINGGLMISMIGSIKSTSRSFTGSRRSSISSRKIHTRGRGINNRGRTKMLKRHLGDRQ